MISLDTATQSNGKAEFTPCYTGVKHSFLHPDGSGSANGHSRNASFSKPRDRPLPHWQIFSTFRTPLLMTALAKLVVSVFSSQVREVPTPPKGRNDSSTDCGPVP